MTQNRGGISYAKEAAMSDPAARTNDLPTQRTPLDPDATAWMESGPTFPSPSGVPMRMFGDYELLGEIGRGGMGVVYKARQIALDRLVALKMILPGEFADDEDLRRFHTEAEATAKLQHPGIVRVYEVGEIDGKLYYSMDYIEGPSLSKRLASGPLPGRTAARYVAAVARAIHYAHRNGILHRDLKPSNILLDPDDQPHVTDFGLAKKIGGDSQRTRSGTILGTPSYMAPEQASGKIHELGPACDIYGLGAMLYELVTGRPPFRSETPLDTLMEVIDREPVPPRLLNTKVDRDLETICLKCLEKRAHDRYASAEAMAVDLQRYLNGDAISARSINVLDRMARTLERSQHDIEFRSYGNMVLLIALVVGLTHLPVFAWTVNGPPYPVFWIGSVRVAQIGLMGLIYLWMRPRQLVPASSAERQLWSIWIAYLTASFCAAAVGRFLETQDSPFDEQTLFPFWALLAGVAFFVMGGGYWGWCYAIGIAFFLGALAMPFALRWSALITAALWVGGLTAVGLHLRRIGTEEARRACTGEEQETS
jgi:predicted Ser/Thr protein kinase